MILASIADIYSGKQYRLFNPRLTICTLGLGHKHKHDTDMISRKAAKAAKEDE